MMMRLLSLPASFFHKFSPGELKSRSMSVGEICSLLLGIIMSTGLTSLVSLLYITQIITYAPSLVVPSMVIILVTVFFSVISTVMQIRIDRRVLEYDAKESGMSYGMITGMQKIKLSGAEKRAFAKWLLDPTGHCCLIADEMNMGDANLLVALFHPILDGSITEYAMPGRGNIPLAKHLMMFATCNIGYAGEQDANPATRSRFGAFELGQPKSIKPILHSAVAHDTTVKGIKTELSEDYFNQTEKFYSACRRAASSSDASITDQCLNIRGLVRALVMTSRFNGRLTLRQAIEDEVVTPCDDEERPQISMILDSTVSL